MKLTSLLKITRPINVIITFISIIVAAIICHSESFSIQNVLLAAFSATLTAASGNIINDISDIEIDKINRPMRPLPSGKITIKEAYVLISTLIFISLFLAFLISFPVFIIVIVSHLLLFLYSKYLKRIPLLGNITVAFLTGLVFIFGGVVVENPNTAIIPAVFAFLINLIREVVKDMQDIEGDINSGVKSIPIQLGFKKSKFIILFLTLTLILLTNYPFITKLYNIEFFIVVMIIVNPILVYCLKILFKDHSIINLNRISSLLKINMVFGLIAILLGV